MLVKIWNSLICGFAMSFAITILLMAGFFTFTILGNIIFCGTICALMSAFAGLISADQKVSSSATCTIFASLSMWSVKFLQYGDKEVVIAYLLCIISMVSFFVSRELMERKLSSSKRTMPLREVDWSICRSRSYISGPGYTKTYR